MKLIALKDFSYVGPLKQLDIPGTEGGSVRKGTVFEIGKADKLKLMPHAERELIAGLAVAGCIGPGDDPALAKRVAAEVEADIKRVENAKRTNLAASQNAITGQIVACLQALQQ